MDWGSQHYAAREYEDLTPRGADDSGRPTLATDRRFPSLNRKNPALAQEMLYDRLREMSDMMQETGIGTGEIRYGKGKTPGIKVGEEYVSIREGFLLIDNIRKQQEIDAFNERTSFGNQPDPSREARPTRGGIMERLGR
jgi:hypothetical protein